MSKPVYNAESNQQWDQFTIENEPVSPIDLMERAATLVTKNILGSTFFDKAFIFCGPGNNGGDGLVIGRLLNETGKKVIIYCLDIGPQSNEFLANYKRLPESIEVIHLSKDQHQFNIDEGLIIDGIFGSGLNRSIDGWIGEVISRMNKSQRKIISIDLPSGLFMTDNHLNKSFPNVIEAQETISFMSPKMPFFFATYQKNIGRFKLLDIGLSKNYKGDKIAEFLEKSDIKILKRDLYSHKGSNGFLTIIAGTENLTGAAVLASKAAFRTGAGYVGTVCSKEGKNALNAAQAEVMWQDPENFDISVKSLAVAIGPGLGTTEKSLELLIKAIKSNRRLVVDADAITLLSENPDLIPLLPEHSILTPHLGELIRLIGPQDSSENRLAAQLEFSIRHNLFIIQKGPYSKLTTPDGRIVINSTGNPGMASAGMGDALTGIIGSLLAQQYSPEQAAKYGMFIHGYAADLYAHNIGEIGMLASDIIEYLPKTLNELTV
jgi:NAD(P)H-hydrate epimerase